MNLSHLLDEAKEGRLSPADAGNVAALLRHRPDSDDAYTAIHILGRAGATGYRDLVASFLDSPDDPELARIALVVLVDHWGFGSEYRDRLRSFVRGVEWDADDDVRLVALSAAGEVARTTRDRRLVSDLLDIAVDSHEGTLIRDTAFDAVARALGAGYDELRRWSKLAPDDSWADSIVRGARAFVNGGA